MPSGRSWSTVESEDDMAGGSFQWNRILTKAIVQKQVGVHAQVRQHIATPCVAEPAVCPDESTS